MYQPPLFREDDLAVQHELIRARPFGFLVTLASTGLTANPLPFVLDASAGERGTLRCHVARGNPLWKDFDATHGALVIFSGLDRYITPSWYATKRESGKVVPTWNYAAVHVYGPLIVKDDRDWLAGHVAELTAQQERPRQAPWAVSDAPAPFVEGQLRGIVGLEIPIVRLEGKWKMSQNRTAADRAGVIEGLGTEPDAEAVELAALIKERNRERS
ncbi:MAG: FMN-binding negative transcriptional regulator [Xanthobacteraceae bacterium]|uniref:FMN-binding negative transcriptional regulator n=1 Tax=Pseudolabrys sp. TaxID=1960880 RepID=UPI003D09EB0B